jgi:hypothetical protein
MRFEITPADVVRLKALGVRADVEISEPTTREEQLSRRSETYRQAMMLAIESERRAWREARRWRLFGYLGLFCAAASVAAQLLAMAARRGGW